ncbi:hypothetical protein [Streptomyces sp. NPDC095613]|uniref:hypothetical protein n=1 Tax=Streptomyces sp. NPDC095613 TaxID=3155540 RepID=UPI0033303AA2
MDPRHARADARSATYDTKDASLRLLPWTTPDGRPCYLSAAGPDSRMSRLADEVEEDLLASAEHLLADIKSPPAPAPTSVPDDADPSELRRMVACLVDALRTTLRIAVSRGARLPLSEAAEPCAHRRTEVRAGKVCCDACGQQIYL